MRSIQIPKPWNIAIEVAYLGQVAGQSSSPPTGGNTHGKALAELNLEGPGDGNSPKRVLFHIAFLPDGSKLRTACATPAEGDKPAKVQAEMNYCQLAPIITQICQTPACRASYAEHGTTSGELVVEVTVGGMLHLQTKPRKRARRPSANKPKRKSLS